MSDQRPAENPPNPVRRKRASRWAVALVVALVVAVGLATAGILQHDGATTTEPDPDSPTSPAAPTAIGKPGTLLRTDPVKVGAFSGVKAWRITYATTRDQGEPAIATALVVTSSKGPDAPRPVIAWAHGTTGIATDCAPSLLGPQYAAYSIPGYATLISEGAVIVATDYIGLGTPGPSPYLIGQGEGRSVLDSVRAVQHLKGVEVADRTVVWGHSQGGGAALWSGILAPTYAPDAHVIGVAGIAPASDLIGLVDNLRHSSANAAIESYVLSAYADAYPDVDFDSYVRPEARAVLREMAGHCLGEYQKIQELTQELPADGSYFARDPSTGPLAERLAENVPDAAISAPVFIGQGAADVLVLPSVQAAYVARRCALGTGGALEFRTYPGKGHTDVIAAASPLVPDLLAWTTDRFAGRPATSTC
ncbi:MAG: hypothetical protein JWQ74_2857 [Marmoricola sp.]|nr:hypothetical protein [Marmoricola sp.]